MKEGRNKLCSCGSGRKFKKCCEKINNDLLNNINKTPVANLDISIHYEELNNIEKNSYDKRYCMAPDSFHDKCSGIIIKSHSVSKGYMLKEIAQNNQVYYFKPGIISFLKNSKVQLKLTSINLASTFTGFCSFHDNELFKKIENNKFDIRIDHLFLLSYRAICRELFIKKIVRSAFKNRTEFLISKGIIEKDNVLVLGYIEGSRLGINDLKKQKRIYDRMLKSDIYEDYKYYLLEFENISPVLCSTSKLLFYDLKGNMLNTKAHLNELVQNIQFNISIFNGKTFVQWSWTKYSDEYAKMYLDYILNGNHKNIGNIIVSYTLANFENVCISPILVDTNDNKNKIIKLINTMASTEPMHIEKYLTDFKLNWKLKNIYKNF